MTADTTATLTASLDSLDVPWEQVAADEFEATLEEHLLDPAVGVPLSGVDADLASVTVTVDPTPAELDDARTGVTGAAFAVADYGSVVIPSTAAGTELVSLFVDRHVVVLEEGAVVPDMQAGFERFAGADADSAILATGPSATADMGALVRGAHGPSEVHVLVLEGDE